MERVHLHLMDRGQKLSVRMRKELLDPVRSGLDTLGKYAPKLDADLALVPTDIYTHPNWYRSGKAFGPGFAQIEVNMNHPRFSQNWAREAEALVLHELHHCIRWPYVSEQWTIGEVIVLEGLAMIAENTGSSAQLDDGQPPSATELDALCERAWHEKDWSESETTAWFRQSADFAGGEVTAPVNYFIGRAMMESALSRLGLDPFEAAALPSSNLLEAAR